MLVTSTSLTVAQDFIWQVHKRGPDELQLLSSSTSSHRIDNSPLKIDVFNTLLESFEAKKKWVS
jgi:hypothetical protein